MAITYTSGLNNLSNAENTTNWSGFNDGSGGTPGAVNETDIFIQGSASVSAKISGTGQNKGLIYTIQDSPLPDFTQAGVHFYGWCAVTTVGLLNTRNAGGLYVKAEDLAGNWSKWYVGGSDVTTAGFVRYVLDLNKPPSETSGTLDLTAVALIGFGIKSTGTSKSENLIVDRIDYGVGKITVSSDAFDSVTWDDLFQEDDSSANKWGIIEKRSGVYYLKGGIRIGAPGSGGSIALDDESGATLVFEDPQYDDASGSPSVGTAIDSTDLYIIDQYSDSTVSPADASRLDLGLSVGTGDDRQGYGGGVITTAGQPWKLDLQTDVNGATIVNRLFGVTFVGAKNGVLLDKPSANEHRAISCSFVNCGEVDPGTTNNGILMLSCFIVDPDSGDSNSPRVNYGLKWPGPNHNIKKLFFVAGSELSATEETYMVRFPSANYSPEDFETAWEDMQFFGQYGAESPQLNWHGINEDPGADITINATGTTNADAADFYNNGSPLGTVTVSQSATVTLTGLIGDETEVRVYEAGSSPYTELAGAEIVGSPSEFDFTLQAGTVVDIVIFAIGYEPVYILEFTIPTSSTAIPVEQRFDRNYRNP